MLKIVDPGINLQSQLEIFISLSIFDILHNKQLNTSNQKAYNLGC
jgi:hypothetical protein